MTIFYAFVVISLCGSALAQVPARGACPKIAAQSNFEVKKFLGRWYEAERFYTHYELGSKCNRVDYSRGRNSTTVNRLETFINTFTGKPQTYHREVRVPDPKRNPAKAVLNFPASPVGAIFNKWVLGTDYNNYAVVYGCTPFGSLRVQYSWILTRDQNPTRATMKKAYRVVQNKRINRANYIKVNQKDCDDDDEEDTSEKIRFVS